MSRRMDDKGANGLLSQTGIINLKILIVKLSTNVSVIK